MGQYQVGQYMHYKSPRKRREKGTESLFKEITAENFPKLGKQTDIQIREAHKVTNKMNPKLLIPRHIIIKLSKIKNKGRILMAARGIKTKTKNLLLQGNPHKITSRFSSETTAGNKP